MFIIHYRRIAVAYFSAMISLLMVFACTSTSPDGKGWAEASAQDEHTGESTQALTGTHKVCSAVVPGNFRDSIEVDNGWSAFTCLGWVQSVGGTAWQLGCLFTNGFSWGASNGGIPGPNCGW